MELSDSKSLADFFMNGRSAHYSKGEIILVGDNDNLDVHFVSKGFIKVYSINDEGDEYTHIIYKTGDIFPLIWALKGLKRHVFYESMDSCVIWKIPKETFTAHLKANSDNITYSLLEQLADQFNIYADRLDNLQYKSAHERVVYRLLFLAGRFGKKNGKDIIIEAPITHKSIASSINLARESVSREMELLAGKGLIDNVAGQIIIREVVGLSKEFSEPVRTDYWGLK